MIRRTARIFVLLGPSKSVLCADLAHTLFRYSNCVRPFFIQPHGCAHSPPRLEPFYASAEAESCFRKAIEIAKAHSWTISGSPPSAKISTLWEAATTSESFRRRQSDLS